MDGHRTGLPFPTIYFPGTYFPRLKIQGLSQQYLSQSKESQEFVSHVTTFRQPEFLGLFWTRAVPEFRFFLKKKHLLKNSENDQIFLSRRSRFSIHLPLSHQFPLKFGRKRWKQNHAQFKQNFTKLKREFKIQNHTWKNIPRKNFKV